MNNEINNYMNNKTIIRLVSVTLALLSLFLLVKVFAGVKSYGHIGNEYPPQNVITVSGEGEVNAVPDIAETTFEVREEAKDVPTAQANVTKKMNDIIAALKKAGIDEKDIKTTGYNIYPKYEYSTPEPKCLPGGSCVYPQGKQTIVGYEVSHNITLKIRKTTEAGKILSDLGSMKVTNLSGLNFTIDDEDALKAEARKKAIADAKAKAEVLTKDLGVKILRVVNFSESGNYPIYYSKLSADAGGMGGVVAPTPEIPAGENKITSNVTITYEIR